MALTAAPVAGQAIIEKSFEAAQHLLVGLPFAAVTIQDTSSESIEVSVKVSGDDDRSAHRLADQLRLRVRQSESTVKVQMPPLPARMLSAWSSFEVPPIVVEISVPESVKVDASIISGTLSAAGLEGRVTLESKGGTIHGRDLSGRLEVIGLGSTVLLNGLSGSSLMLRCAGGSLQAEGMEMDRHAFHLSGMRARLDGITGPSNVYANGSAVSVSGVEAAMSAEIRAGRFQLEMREPAPVRLDNAGGHLDLTLALSLMKHLHIDAPSGDVYVSPAGRDEPSDEAGAPIRIHSLRGSIHCASL